MPGSRPEDTTRYRVIRDHQASQPDPLRARENQQVSFERRPSEFPGWIWCTTSEGKTGWVPESWVTVEGTSCVFLRDYDAIELTVSKGELVSAGQQAAGWVWVTSGLGASGWVPLDNLAEA